MNIQKVLNEKLSEIKPSSADEKIITEFVGDFMPKLNKGLKKFKARAVLGGSFSKGTTIKKDKYDVDVFAVFPKKAENISDKLGKVIRGIKFNATRLPGSRDYFSIKVSEGSSEFRIEIVPVIETKKAEEAANVTDVSVLHVAYVKSKISGEKSLSDEIRLAKAFCYAQGCYGAESHIKGFSGYCLEILTSYYGGFTKLARSASKWGDKVVLDPEKHYKKKDEIMTEVNEAKLMSPLVLIDPVQKNRNIAAALDSEKFDLFRKACRSFISSPSAKFFEKKALDEDKIVSEASKKGLEAYKVHAMCDKVKEDISGAKLLKLHNLVISRVEKEGYSVKAHWDFSGKESNSYLIIMKSPAKILRKGPQVKMEAHAKAFKKRWKKVFVKNGWLFSEDKPKSVESILKLDGGLLEEMGIDSYSYSYYSKK